MAATAAATMEKNKLAKPKNKPLQDHEPFLFLPATKSKYRKYGDTVTVNDMLSGFGGLTRGFNRAGYDVIRAINHVPYKIAVHARNEPYADHYIANLVNEGVPSYLSPRAIPGSDVLVAGVSCTSHSWANSQRRMLQDLNLFDLVDPEYEERVTKSERDRATATCVLMHVETHHPKAIVIECTCGLQNWGPSLNGSKTIGDGSYYRRWLAEFEKLGYDYKVLYLNAQFFGVPQSRDRLFIVFWDRSLRAPDLDFRFDAHCDRCDETVPAVWSWKTRLPASGRCDYGKQYDYRCPRCRREVVPPMTPAAVAIDWTNLGQRIGDRPKPLAASTMDRVRRCIAKFAEFPAVLMPAKGAHGVERTPDRPMSTQTSQQETALLTSGSLAVVAGNSFERPGSDCRIRGPHEQLWTQPGTPQVGLVSPPMVMPFRRGNASPITDPVGTQTSVETFALVGAGLVPFRRNTLPVGMDQPAFAQTAQQIPAIVSAAVVKQNGGGGDTAPHPVLDPFGTMTSKDTTGLVTISAEDWAEWERSLAGLAPEDAHLRMLSAEEIQTICGFDAGFVTWGSQRDKVDGFGNAVVPSVAEAIALRLKAVL